MSEWWWAVGILRGVAAFSSPTNALPLLVSPCLTRARKVMSPVPAGGGRKTNRSRKPFSSASLCMRACPPQPGSGGVQKRGDSSNATSHVPTLISCRSTAYKSSPRYFAVSLPTIVVPRSRFPTMVRTVTSRSIGRSSPGTYSVLPSATLSTYASERSGGATAVMPGGQTIGSQRVMASQAWTKGMPSLSTPEPPPDEKASTPTPGPHPPSHPSAASARRSLAGGGVRMAVPMARRADEEY